MCHSGPSLGILVAFTLLLIHPSKSFTLCWEHATEKPTKIYQLLQIISIPHVRFYKTTTKVEVLSLNIRPFICLLKV